MENDYINKLGLLHAYMLHMVGQMIKQLGGLMGVSFMLLRLVACLYPIHAYLLETKIPIKKQHIEMSLS